MKLLLLSFGILLSWSVSACGGNGSANASGTGGAAGSAGSAAGGQGGQGGQGGGSGSDAGGEAAGPSVNAADVGFKPSNLPANLDIPVSDDMIFNGQTCGTRAEIDTDKGEIRCYSPGLETRHPYFKFSVVKQGDGSEVAVFAARNIEADAAVEIDVVGQRPLVLLAQDSVTLRGPVSAIHDSIYNNQANAGGFSGPSTQDTKGLGPGGGGPSNSSAGAGGGGFCGLGGLGGGSASGAIGAHGASYGTPTLIPLIGGSSGGRGFSDSGAGGGAVQVVAGTSIDVTATGVIHVGGAGGGWGSAGGGSGGAILLEAPDVTIAGILAANGGGGGGGTANGHNGTNASGDANFAPGGTGSASTDSGGNGAAANKINGSPGGTTGGAGGGGAGRIRINTSSGAATISGTVSPSLTTACATQGLLGT